MIYYLFILLILGTIFGSFATVLIERWKANKSGIMTGRSECPSCHHTLSARELVPIFSYLFQKGRCHNCGTHIPIFYLLTEIFFGILFVCGGYIGYNFGLSSLSFPNIILFILIFITGVYIVYDIRFMEIPDQILLPGIFLLIILQIYVYIDGNPYGIMHDASLYPFPGDYVYDHIIGAWIIYTFFYLQILIPGGFHLLKNKRYSKVGELFLGYFIFPFYIFIEKFLSKQEESEENIPTWIGGGDLRIALFIGLSMGTFFTVSTLFFAYILGSIIALILLGKGTKTTQSQIPFGPFLGIGWILSLIFSNEIIEFIEKYNSI